MYNSIKETIINFVLNDSYEIVHFFKTNCPNPFFNVYVIEYLNEYYIQTIDTEEDDEISLRKITYEFFDELKSYSDTHSIDVFCEKYSDFLFPTPSPSCDFYFMVRLDYEHRLISDNHDNYFYAELDSSGKWLVYNSCEELDTKIIKLCDGICSLKNKYCETLKSIRDKYPSYCL